jgi:hypothetical protein
VACPLHDGYLIGHEDRVVCSPNWGRNAQVGMVPFANAHPVSEVNPDPVTLTRSGYLAMCIPDGDTPRIYTFGQAEPAIHAPDRFQNTNPGP